MEYYIVDRTLIRNINVEFVKVIILGTYYLYKGPVMLKIYDTESFISNNF